MTKLTEQNLPHRKPFYHCEKCGHYVPFEDKHNRKRHKNERKN